MGMDLIMEERGATVFLLAGGLIASGFLVDPAAGAGFSASTLARSSAAKKDCRSASLLF